MPAIITAPRRLMPAAAANTATADKAAGVRDRSGLRHEGRSRDREAPLRLSGQDYFFCCARCRERFEAEPEKFLQPKQPEPAAPAGAIYTCPMHPEVRQVGPGQLPDLRHGAGARAGLARRCAGSRTDRHDQAVLDRAGADASGVRDRDGQPSRPDASGAAGLVELDFVCAGDAGGAVGRRAVLCARLAIAGHPQSQHVHADRDGHRRGLALQRGGHAGAATVSAGVSRHARRGRGVFRGGGGHHGSGAARAGAGIAGARAHLGRDPRAARAGAENRAAHHRRMATRMSRSTRSRSAICLRVRPGEKIPVDGVVTEGQLRRRRIHGDRRVDAGVEGRRRLA